MRRYVLTCGSIAGTIIIATAIVASEFADTRRAASLEWLGYLIMVLALSVIFVGIRRYRDRELGGAIRFSTGFLVGFGISSVAAVIYVVAWELYLAATDHAFIDVYIEAVLEERRAEGARGTELDELSAGMESIREQYADPLFRIPMTFLEILPVGLIVTLFSAFLLRSDGKPSASARTD